MEKERTEYQLTCGRFKVSSSNAQNFWRIHASSIQLSLALLWCKFFSWSPQIFSKVGYPRKCLWEVVLWTSQYKGCYDTRGSECDLEPEVRRKRISPSTSHWALAKALDSPQSQQWGLTLSNSDESETLQQTASIKMNQQTRVMYLQGKHSAKKTVFIWINSIIFTSIRIFPIEFIVLTWPS